MKGKAFEWAASQVWCVTPDVYALGLEIAARSGDRLDGREEPYENEQKPEDIRDGVAVVPIQGPLFKHAGLFSDISGGTSTSDLAAMLSRVKDDPRVKAVVLDIDSPGGEAKGTAAAAEAIRSLSTVKPVVAFVDGSAQSGAYWLASAASRIVMAPMSLAGSIGVVTTVRHPDDRKDRTEIVSTFAPLKRADVRTEAGRSEYQARADDMHDVFEQAVAAGRGVPVELVRERFGKGGSLVAHKAVEVGMADSVGTLDSVIRDLAGGALPTRAHPQKKGNAMNWKTRVLEALFGGDSDSETADATPPTLAEIREKVTSLKPMSGVNVDSAGDVSELRKKIADYEAKERAGRLDGIATEAKAFADDAIRANRAYPAERRSLIEAFAQAKLDDLGIASGALVNDAGEVSFLSNADGTPNRFSGRTLALKTMVEARTPHCLTKETIDAPLDAVAPERPAAAADDEAFAEGAKNWAQKRYPAAR